MAIAARARRGIGMLVAVNALVMAATPWLGRVGGDIDVVAATFPLAPIVAVLAVTIAGRPARSWSVPLAMAALVLAAAGWWAELAPAHGSTAGGARLVIVTHNVAVANADPEATAVALAASDADILLLQETDGRFFNQIGRLRTRFPYGSACRRHCSVAILSRWPTDQVRYRFRDEDGRPFGPPLVQTIVHAPAPVGDMLVASLHLPRSFPAVRRAALRRNLVEAARRVGSTSTVIGGDFNLVPWSPAMRTLDRDLGPMHRVTRALFSFPEPLPVVPIDHVFAGAGWWAADATRLTRTGSDHYPIRVELVWQRK